jgi:sulfide:quinone oxidoreductase
MRIPCRAGDGTLACMAGVRPQKVLVAGDGIAGLETVLALQSLAHGRLDIEMLAPERHFTYRPLAGDAPFERCTPARVELAGIARDRGFRLTRDAVDRVDPRAHEVVTQDGARISYDVLIVALGARPTVAVEGAVPFRGPQDLAAVADALQAVGSPARVAYVARSATMWTLPLYELALHTAAWVDRRDADVEVLLVTGESTPLEAFGADASRQVAKLFERAGVRLILDTTVSRVSAMPFEVDLAVALPQLVGPALPGLPHDAEGFVPVDTTGRVRGVGDVYALGAMTDRPLRQDGLAAQQADVVAATVAGGAGSYEPCLRARLVSGDEVLHLGSTEPPHEFAGRHLAPYLGTHGDLAPVG